MDEEVNRDKTGETNTRSLSGRDRVGFSFRVFFYLAIFPTTLINACLFSRWEGRNIACGSLGTYNKRIKYASNKLS